MSAELTQQAAVRPWPRHAQIVTELALRTKPRCVICARIATSAFTVNGYLFFSCAACDYAFLDPAVAFLVSGETLFGDEYFCGGGAGYPNYFDEADLLRSHGTRYGRLLARVGARRVLDVGAAAGFIMLGMIQAGCGAIGIEPNVSMAAYAVRELGLDVRATTLERSPGHASHHVSYLHEPTGRAFTGDVAGVRIDGGCVLAPTPPPDVDLRAWRASLDLIEAWRPRSLAVTHFGG